MSVAMMRSVEDAEAAYLETMRAHYEGRGYDFVVKPHRSQLPDFLLPSAPDAIATKPGDNIVIGLVSRAQPAARPSLTAIRDAIKDRPDWQLTVVHMGGDRFDVRELPVVDRNEILRRVGEVERLAREDHTEAAFVMAWGLLEAALNSLHPDADKRPRRPGTVIQTLSMNGHITYEEERALRPLIGLRNQIVHGDLGAVPTADDVHQVLMAVRTALEQPAES